MQVVVALGGKQYLVEKNSIIKTELIKGESVNDNKIIIEGDQVLSKMENGEFENNPNLKVEAEILEEKRDKKIVVFKQNRRKRYRRKAGFRKDILILKIVDFK